MLPGLVLSEEALDISDWSATASTVAGSCPAGNSTEEGECLRDW